jgi:hypothetical protein
MDAQLRSNGIVYSAEWDPLNQLTMASAHEPVACRAQNP